MDPNTWVNVCRDADGARRHSSFRYVPDLDAFLLWGYLSYDVFIYGGPHIPRTDPPEYDIVVYDPDVGRWENHLPFEREVEWRRRLPPMYLCRNYHGITTGSYRPQLKVRDGVLRPDLNIVFDQVTYDVARSQMVYVTGGRTFGYDVRRRAWSDLARGEGPPPVLGGSLCADPFNDEIILFGGGHVAERGAHGGLVGYTGTWIYACDDRVWRPLESRTTPPPRMATRMVCDTRNRLLVLFGGDGQTHYLADTWVYDTRTRRWRESGAPDGPPPRAGHFTVYDPSTGWVIVGGGHNRRPLTDMWAYDASENRWFRLKGKVPVGWHVTADIRPEDGLIVLTTAKKHARMKRHCDELFLVRTTYAFRIDGRALVDEAEDPVPHAPLPKRSRQERTRGTRPNRARREAQSRRLAAMPHNTWVPLEEPGRAAPLRTWGSCTFDTDR